ncbi:MAG: ABC transporter permease subunit [Pirellulales bacterium]
MNVTLLKKSLIEARWLLLGSVAIVFAFEWLYVWLVSQIPMKQFAVIVGALPKPVLSLSPIPVAQWLTVEGRIAMSFNEPIILLVLAAWSIGRGSDAVSGELSRGTLEMVLAQPVSRSAVLAANATVTVLGCVAIAAASWLGLAVGMALIPLDTTATSVVFLPAAANTLMFGFFLSGATTALSAADRYRWRTIGIVCAVFLVQKIVEIIALMVERFAWLKPFTFFSLFKAPMFVTDPDKVATLFWQYNGTLVALGLAGYALAAVIFSRRDLPAPL